MQQHTLKLILFATVVALGMTACSKDPTDEPATTPPQQQLPNPLPENALVIQTKWTEIDHQAYSYNTRGQVSQLWSQWQYVEGDPTKIRTIVYNFQYDAQDKPTGIQISNGFSVKYFHNGDFVKKTQELYPGGAENRDVTYVYDGNRIVKEIRHESGLPGEPWSTFIDVLEYDDKGNLTIVKTYIAVNGWQYDLVETREYSDFDDKINPISWTLRYPYLPQVRWQFNNPRREVRRTAGGNVETVTYEYEYNGQGLPVARRKTGPGGEATMEYLY